MTTSPLALLADSRISNNSELQTFCDNAKRITKNVIFPDTIQFSDPTYRYGVRIIKIDPTDTQQAYKNSDGRYILHYSAVRDFADAFGITFGDSEVVQRERDADNLVTYVAIKVTGKLRAADGLIRESVATGYYDYYADLAKSKTPGEAARRRFKADQFAETNAKYRCIRDLFPKLPGSFSYRDLESPFVIPCLIEDVSSALSKHPELEKQYLAKKYNLMNPQPAPEEVVERKERVEEIQEAVIVKTTSVDNKKQQKQEILPKEANAIYAKEYLDQPENVRVSKIKELLTKKGKSWTGTKPVEQCSAKEQVQYIEALLNLPDAPTKGDDLPFN